MEKMLNTAKQNPLETAEVGARRHREEHSPPVP